MKLRIVALGSALALVACHGRHVGLLAEGSDAGCDGLCAPIFDASCSDSKLPTAGGGCEPIGVVACGVGFDPDGKGGCTAHLDASCTGPGKIALPGAACRTVAACDTSIDPWGGLPTDRPILYVDGATTDPKADGTRAHPYATLSEADLAAGGGNTILAVRPGTYTGDFELQHGDLWGACDGVVELVGTSAKGAALHLAGPQTARHVAIRGPGGGVETTGSGGTLDDVWIHDVGGEGVRADHLTITNCLIEGATGAGLHATGLTGSLTLTLQRSVIRDVRPVSGQPESGRGVWLANAGPAVSGTGVHIQSSVIDGAFAAGIDATSVRLDVVDSLVRATKKNPEATGGGMGMRLRSADLTLTGSVLVDNASAGIDAVDLARFDVQNVFIDATRPDAALGTGFGIHAVGGFLHLVSSKVSGSYADGLLLEGGRAQLESVLVSDTHSFGGDVDVAFGVRATYDAAGRGSTLTLSRTSVVASSGVGVAVVGGSASIQDSALRKTALVTSTKLGNGLLLSAQAGSPPVPSITTVARTLIDQSQGAGIQIFGSTLAFDGSVVSGCTGAPIYVASQQGNPPTFTAHDGSQCGCNGVLEECTTAPSPLSP